MTFILFLNWVFGQLLMETISLWSNLCHLGKWNHLKDPPWTGLVVDAVCWDHTWGCGQNTSRWVLPGTCTSLQQWLVPRVSRRCITFYDLPTRSHAGLFLAHSVHWSVQFQWKENRFLLMRSGNTCGIGNIFVAICIWKTQCAIWDIKWALMLMRNWDFWHGRKESQM